MVPNALADWVLLLLLLFVLLLEEAVVEGEWTTVAPQVTNGAIRLFLEVRVIPTGSHLEHVILVNTFLADLEGENLLLLVIERETVVGVVAFEWFLSFPPPVLSPPAPDALSNLVCVRENSSDIFLTCRRTAVEGLMFPLAFSSFLYSLVVRLHSLPPPLPLPALWEEYD